MPEFETGGRRTAGKVVVVTGAARGQGAAEVAALAAEGALVIATDVHDEAPAGAAAAYRCLDVSRPEDSSPRAPRSLMSSMFDAHV